jgi:glyoxylase-like metal-dependent hydrolase (beta-lactamase superfamily II)
VQLAPSLHRLGDDRVACYLIEEAGAVTVVDAGLPAYYSDLVTELAAMGRSIDDVDALVLTHGHSDHIGFAERMRTAHGTEVTVHELDAELARGEVPNPTAGTGETKLSSMFGFLLYSVRKGALRIKTLGQVSTFTVDGTLDVPGSPRVIHAPGHTPGSVALYSEHVDALLVGDVLSTLAVTTGRAGAQIAPFGANPDEALASLENIEQVEAGWLLPGHGAPWTDGVAAAVAAARSTGVDHLARPKN